jgi:hypothetical protein
MNLFHLMLRRLRWSAVWIHLSRVVPVHHTYTHFLHQLKGGSPGKSSLVISKSSDGALPLCPQTWTTVTCAPRKMCCTEVMLHQWKFSTLDPSGSEKGPQQVMLCQIWYSLREAIGSHIPPYLFLMPSLNPWNENPTGYRLSKKNIHIVEFLNAPRNFAISELENYKANFSARCKQKIITGTVFVTQ